MQTVQRQTVIAALEMAYDYYSARTVLKRHLRAANLDSDLERFDAAALDALIASLGQEGSRTAPVIGMLARHAGNVVATATRAEPAREAKKADDNNKKADDNDKKADDNKVEAKKDDAQPTKKADASDNGDDGKKASRGKSKGKSRGKSKGKSSAVIEADAASSKKSSGRKKGRSKK